MILQGSRKKKTLIVAVDAQTDWPVCPWKQNMAWEECVDQGTANGQFNLHFYVTGVNPVQVHNERELPTDDCVK